MSELENAPIAEQTPDAAQPAPAMLTEVAVEQDVLEMMVSALTPEQLLSAEKSLTRKAEGMYPPVCQLAERPAAAKKTDSAFLI